MNDNIKLWFNRLKYWFLKWKKGSQIATQLVSSREELEQFLLKLSPKTAILESDDRIEFGEFTRQDGILLIRHPDTTNSLTELNDWVKGTAFCEEYEVCWHKTGEESFQIFIISDSKKLIPFGFNTKDLNGFEVRNYPVYLWGRREPGWPEWREDRIPRSLYYPGGAGNSPMITVKEYRKLSWENNSIKEEMFYRFVKLGNDHADAVH